jgi:hypothetical protein
MATKSKQVQSSSSTWSRAFKQKQEWNNKDDLLDVVYWLRQVLSLILGMLWGVVPLTGAIGMILYLLLSSGFVYLYCTVYQGVDEEEVGGAWELVKEGFMTSFAMFMVHVISY